MLSVSKLTPGQEGYYERSVAAGLDDYYAGRGESPGVWAGGGAAALGLEGEVEEGELGALVRSKHPKTGEELRAHVQARTITIERIEPESGKRWLEEKKLVPRFRILAAHERAELALLHLPLEPEAGRAPTRPDAGRLAPAGVVVVQAGGHGALVVALLPRGQLRD